MTKMSYEQKKRRVGWVFILPWAVGSLLFFLIPLVQSAMYAFSKLHISGGSYSLSWVGFSNFIEAFTLDSEFVRKVTAAIGRMLYQTPLIVLFSLFIAIVLNQKFLGRTFVRGVFFLPVIIANGVIITIINGDIMSQAIMASSSSSQLFQAELLGDLLFESGLNQNFVNAITGVVDNMFSLIWKFGVQVLIFLAGLQSIDPALYEAGRIDGATGWESFWKITFPLLMPMVLLNLIFTIVDSFTDYANEVMAYINSKQVTMELEYSAALSWIYFLFVMIIIGAVYLLINRWTEF